MNPSAIVEAAEVLATASCAVGFSGAGISAGSGIPTFREAHGIWTRYPVEEYGTADAFLRDPEKTWELFGNLAADLDTAVANPAHLAMAELETRGHLCAVVTQNIDGLHQRAGSVEVIEYHGNTATGHCPSCQRSFTLCELPPWPPAPRCPQCVEVIRPDVVLFGDPIPEAAARRAQELFTVSDAVLAVGSSLQVAPASWLLVAAANRGSAVIVVDPDPSEIAARAATVTLAGPAEEVLPALVAALDSPRDSETS